MQIKKRLAVFWAAASALAVSVLFSPLNAAALPGAPADKQAFLVGGSCDEGRNNFTGEFNAWNDFLSSKKWQVHGFIDEAKKTEVADVKPFVWKDFLAALKQVGNGPVKRVLIVISTHGNNENGMHGVCDQSGHYHNIQDLNPILQQLKAHAVQTAVIDGSCYSGFSVSAIGDNASCVMSMAGKHVGSGYITEPVAKGLRTMPTLAKKASVEDVWFSVLNHSVKQLAHVPLITGMPNIVHWVPTPGALARRLFPNIKDFPTESISSRWEQMSVTIAELESGRQFFAKNAAWFERVFSPQALEGISAYLKDGRFMAISSPAASVFYLQAHPKRKDRPCANFYF